MNKTERFSASDPLAGLFRGRVVASRSAACRTGWRAASSRGSRRAEGTLLFVARDARRLAHGGDGARLLRARHPDADLPGLGQPALRPRLAQCRGLRRADERAARAAAAARGPARRLHHRQRHRPARAGPRERRARAPGGAAAGNVVADGAARRSWLETNGFDRTATVREVGEYAVRGGIVDLWAPGTRGADPPRFLRRHAGDDPPLRSGDASARPARSPRLDLVPASEVMLTEETISRFRQNYRAAFGAVTGDDPLYEAVSEGRRFAGMEHWLPLLLRAAGDAVRLPAGRAGRRRPPGRGGDRRPARAGARPLRGAARRRRRRAPAPAPRPTSRSRPRRSISRATSGARCSPTAGTRASRPSRSPRRAGRRSTWAGAPAAPSPPSAPPATSTSSTRWSRMSAALQKAGTQGGARLLERGRARPPRPGARRPRPDSAEAGRELARRCRRCRRTRRARRAAARDRLRDARPRRHRRPGHPRRPPRPRRAASASAPPTR